MKLTPIAPINQLRQAIYERCGIAHFSKGYRSRKLRKVCQAAIGLDLRNKKHVVYLAKHLGLIQANVVHVDFAQNPVAA